MTDEVRVSDPLCALAALPKGAVMILRQRDPATRARAARALSRAAKQRGVIFLIADDPLLAARVDADGVHFPERRAAEARRWRVRHPAWLITIAAHSERTLVRAGTSGANAAIFAPVFRSKSHPDNFGFGVCRFLLMVRRSCIPVFALGGINAANVTRLSGARLAGIAAIEALLPD